MKKIILAAAISVAMAFTCFAANPESDFDYDLVNKNEVKLLSEQFKELNPTEDYVEITYFNGAEGKDAIIEIPEEIEGCKVIKVRLNLQAKKLIVPPSVVYFSFEGNLICNSGDSTNQAPRYIIQLLIARIFPRKRVVTTTPVFGQPIIDSLIRQSIYA